MAPIVFKFGGSSTDSPEKARNILKHVKAVQKKNREAGNPRSPVCLFSALAGVTRKLKEVAEHIEAGNKLAVEELTSSLTKQHEDLLTSLGVHWPLLEKQTWRFDNLRELRPNENPLRLRDEILATGEIVNSRMYAAIFNWFEIPVAWIDPREMIVTDDTHGEAKLNMTLTRPRVRSSILPFLQYAEEDIVPVSAGYVGATMEGVTTTLGWDGSDRSGVAVAASLDAEFHKMTGTDGVREVNTDGVLYGDVLPYVSYDYALDLISRSPNQFLHPDAVRMAKECMVTICVRNADNEHPGTRIAA